MRGEVPECYVLTRSTCLSKTCCAIAAGPKLQQRKHKKYNFCKTKNYWSNRIIYGSQLLSDAFKCNYKKIKLNLTVHTLIRRAHCGRCNEASRMMHMLRLYRGAYRSSCGSSALETLIVQSTTPSIPSSASSHYSSSS